MAWLGLKIPGTLVSRGSQRDERGGGTCSCELLAVVQQLRTRPRAEAVQTQTRCWTVQRPQGQKLAPARPPEVVGGAVSAVVCPSICDFTPWQWRAHPVWLCFFPSRSCLECALRESHSCLHLLVGLGHRAELP